MKRCLGCGEEKPLDAYRVHSRGRFGRYPRCRACEGEALRAKYWADPETARAVNRAKSRKPTDNTTEAQRKAKREWAARNPEKRRAQEALNNAVRRHGLIRQPCEVCGAVAQAHHPDYSRPLDVRWLCVKHHRAEHHLGPHEKR